MEYKDYYQILGVGKKASKDEIKKQYRKLARKYHPDINSRDKEAAKKFAEVSEAHEVLGDNEKRKKYDTLGSDWQRYQQSGGAEDFDWSRYASRGDGGSRTYAYYGGDWDDIFRGGGFSDFFTSIFGGEFGGGFGEPRRQRRNFASPGQDIHAELSIALEEAYAGTAKVISLDGQGMRISLKPGLKDGQTLRLGGKGSSGINKGPKGDLYITIRIDPHPLYKREGDNLFMETSVSVYKAMLGGDQDIQTLSGTFKLKIPPGIQNGTTFRLKGRGFPVYGKKGIKGDLLVKAFIKIPEHLSEQEKELVKKLSALRE